jgi:hypothetical protein
MEVMSFMGFAEGDQNRVWETAYWFAQGFWGINASDHVILKGIPETPGTALVIWH